MILFNHNSCPSPLSTSENNRIKVVHLPRRLPVCFFVLRFCFSFLHLLTHLHFFQLLTLLHSLWQFLLTDTGIVVAALFCLPTLRGPLKAFFKLLIVSYRSKMTSFGTSIHLPTPSEHFWSLIRPCLDKY